MKTKNIIIIVLLLTCTHSFAGDQEFEVEVPATFIGTGRWTGSQLTSEWIAPQAAMLTAIEDALGKCREGLYRFCIYMTARQDSLTYSEVNANAVIRGTNKGKPGTLYTEKKRVTGSNLSASLMTQSAAKFLAIEAATLACFKDGNDDCAIISVEIVSTSYGEVNTEAKVVGITYGSRK